MPSPSTESRAKVPPLRHGDRLDRDEFERRYQAMPHLKKAELIDGVVYMPSPVNFVEHGEPHAHLMAWLGLYRFQSPGVRIGDNATVRLDLGNVPQPDAVMLIDPKHGGRVTLSDGYITHGPELAAEVAASSISLDASAKKQAYARNGVQEYILWRIEDQIIDWFALRGGRYSALSPAADGILRSEAFPGLWLDPTAILSEDFGRVLAVSQLGVASEEHAKFLAKLREE